ncbi:nitroreductase [Tibeticola sp.]|jgi:nitroreductase|uniref:nitroreductase family protein n=1 Tax=Tibeticola sp. TaxID=2005368 RepID=UPI0025850D0E|nr:nitroreductase [Tibeticola sp.]MCI4440882.1 nitroreductase [Tibeticola sp.]
MIPRRLTRFKPTPPAAAQSPALVTDPAEAALQLIIARHNTSPRRLIEPGPNEAELQALWEAAAAAPDHGQLTPWRFVCVPAHRRSDLGDAFAQALVERDPGATPEQIEAAREKANRAPLLILAVADLRPAEPDIAAAERLVSLGCAIQNLLLTAQAMGYGSGLTSGQAMGSKALRRLFGLVDGEEAICFINVGTVSREKPPRTRPEPTRFVRSL